MRIAFVVSDLTFPPAEGLHHQSILLMQQLSASGHDVDLWGFARDLPGGAAARLRTETGVSIKTIFPYRGPQIVLLLLSVMGLSIRHRRLGRALTSGRYDVAHLEGALVAPLSLRSGASVINWIDPGSRRFALFADQTTRIFEKIKYRMASAAFSSVERRVGPSKAPWVVVSGVDAEHLRNRHPSQRVEVIPVIAPRGSLEGCDQSPWADFDSLATRCLFVADLRQHHMQVATLNFFRAAQALSWTGMGLVVLCRSAPSPEIIQAAQGLPVTFREWVPDYAAVQHAAHLIIIPDSNGTGLKNRTVQALASGVPTCGTRVAFEGIEIVSGLHAVVVPSPDELPVAALALARSLPESRNAMGIAGRAAALEFDPDRVRNRWLTLYSSTIACEARDK